MMVRSGISKRETGSYRRSEKDVSEILYKSEKRCTVCCLSMFPSHLSTLKLYLKFAMKYCLCRHLHNAVYSFALVIVLYTVNLHILIFCHFKKSDSIWLPLVMQQTSRQYSDLSHSLSNNVKPFRAMELIRLLYGCLPHNQWQPYSTLVKKFVEVLINIL
jgi:hypothetical protein